MRAFYLGGKTMTETLKLVITIASILVAIGLLLLLANFMKQEKTNKKGLIVGIVTIVFILAGITFGLLTMSTPAKLSEVFMIDSLILVAYIAVIALIIKLQKRNELGKKISNRAIVSIVSIFVILGGVTFALASKEEPASFLDILLIDAIVLIVWLVLMAITMKSQGNLQTSKPISTRKVAFLGILIGLASALMLLGFPIMPMAPFLKVELSGLIVFMALLWFDWKTAVVVSLYTNFIHVFMPGSAPLILFLDEGVNFIATMMFILPMAIFLNKSKLEEKRKVSPVFIISVIGVLFTSIFMTLYNAFINLPIIYNMVWDFLAVVKIFGVFNLIKWGFVAIAINLTWRRLYTLRNFGEETIEEVTD
jgi:riboflavin transporter FmnP